MEAGDRSRLRLALARELETINLYQELAEGAQDAELQELLHHVMDEEQEHVAEFASLLRRADPSLDRAWINAHPEGPGRGEAPAWTVGSLLGSSPSSDS